MHTFSETGAGVPAFLAKLWRLMEDPDTNNSICWSKDGRSFIIQNQAQFARELLPLNYKHNHMASFIRQLNMYGFHKITSIDNGGLKFDRDEMEFSHPCFKRNHAYLLEHIKRKIANTKAIDEKTSMKPEAVSKVLSDVKAMRGRQDSLDSRFSVMKQENEALWREIASLRQKHAKQQQIINKLIQFLITIVQPSRNMTSVKRNMQLMINDNPKSKKLRSASESGSDCGPVIHELGEELLDEVTSNVDLLGAGSPYYNMPSSRHENESPSSSLNAERPQSNMSAMSQSYEYSGNNASCASPGSSSIINAFNPDGSQIIYHVTEVPDNHPIDSKTSIANSSKQYSEENVLTTPMVKEAMIRGELKQKNKQRRKMASAPPTKIQASESPTNKTVKTYQRESVKPIKIKTESSNEIDPLIFLNMNYPSNSGENSNENELDPRVILPDPTDNAQQSDDEDEMYNNIFDSEIPSDLFEDPLLAAENNYKNAKSQSQQINLFPSPANNTGVFPSGSSGGNSKSPSTRTTASRGKNMKTLALTKYSPNKNDIEHEREEISGHVEGVQDELDSLKDLLRSDEYSIDANTLLSLFGDSDILGSYGLPGMSNESSQDKKGSELMTYQPIYDLSDIIDINDENETERDDAAQVNKASGSKRLQPQSSALNTPYHE